MVGFPGATPPGGTGPVADSARQPASFVARVRSATGAARVDLVDHSQGGMMPRYYLRFLGGAARVHAGVKNVRVQDGCGLDASGHLSIAFDRRALRFVLNALDPAHAVAPPCVVVLPAEGG